MTSRVRETSRAQRAPTWLTNQKVSGTSIGGFYLRKTECNRKARRISVYIGMPRTFAAPLISFSVALLLLNACTTARSHAPQAMRYIVSVPKAAFYKYGPAQSFGPDLQLPKGQKITKLDHSFGFSHVMTDDGTTGYIANEDIKPAPPEPAAAASQNPYASSTPKGKKPNRNKNVDPSLKAPGFDINDVPLPSADNTPAPNDPKFRY
jgi:hypothetical protein